MKRNQPFRRTVTMGWALLMFISQAICAQSVDSVHAVIRIGENVINNASHLQPFFEKLYALKIDENPQVNIVHIGDSHIQADFLTEVIRKKLQFEFGNAGRGLIVPGRIAGTNEPLNIRSFSSYQWNAKRIVHPGKPLPIGVGGITINTSEPGAKFFLKMNDPLVDYSFNTVSLFYDEGLYSFNISIQDSLSNEIALIAPNDKAAALNYSRTVLPISLNHVAFQMMKLRDEQRVGTLFGLSLENGRHGVLYHAIGVNGAKYEHYNTADLFASQTRLLKPDLFIISLGTNESVEYPNINKNFFLQVNRLVESLRKANPQAAFILVTPPDAFLRKVKPNPGIETIRSQIIQFAVENGLAFWDMYKVNGGKNSATEWKLKGLLRPDGIHFTREGYAYQGNLLFDAIMQGYQKYVSDRHP
jgi:lysophospholipase L1-like esterase